MSELKSPVLMEHVSVQIGMIYLMIMNPHDGFLRTGWTSSVKRGGERSHHPPNTGALAVNVSLYDLRRDVEEMFDVAFTGYMTRAFPMDDLRPISCTGSNSQGGIAITLLDSLDMLYLLRRGKDLRKAVIFISKTWHFDLDVRVHVFEVTIRALGGLLSGHVLLSRDAQLVPWYKGELLHKAVELADRLLPAFDTATGVPLSWINLKTGQVRGDTRITCTACAGTMLLEFGVLSRLSNNPIYEEKAKKALVYLFNQRSVRGLLGNTFNVDKGTWIRRQSGIGAGIDSYYEYLLKAYLSFGDEDYLNMYIEMYSSAHAYAGLSREMNGVTWLVDVHMTSGRVVNSYSSALAAFWPGLQSLSGQFQDAQYLFESWDLVRRKFTWIPESFAFDMSAAHPVLKYYPLRPEFIESGYILYSDTRNPKYLVSVLRFYQTLKNTTRAPCGFASVSDVSTGQLEDSMESFFLSETLKYLYLLFSNATDVLDQYVLSTEAHFLPSFPHKKDGAFDTKDGTDVSEQCQQLCTANASHANHQDEGTSILGLPMPNKRTVSNRIRSRRCNVCRMVERAVQEKKKTARLQWRIGASNPMKAGSPTVAPWHLSFSEVHERTDVRYFLCILQHFLVGNTMKCAYLKEVFLSDMSSQSMQTLPANSVILELTGIRQKEVNSAATSILEIQYNSTSSASLGRIPGVQALFGEGYFPGCTNASQYEESKHAWTKQMDARFLDDTEEELIYPHEVELTNEEILERIKRLEQQKQDEKVQYPLAPAANDANKQSCSSDDSTCEKTEEKTTQDAGQSDASTMPRIPSCETYGKLVQFDPPHGCLPPKNPEELRNSIVVMTRGHCSFHEKALQAISARASAMIVINNEGRPFPMEGQPQKPSLPIPAVMIGHEASKDMIQNLNQTVRIWQPSWESRVNQTLHLLYGMPIEYLSSTASEYCPGLSHEYTKDPQCSWSNLLYEYQSNNVMQMDLIMPNNVGAQQFLMTAFHEQKSDFSPVFQAVRDLLM